MAERCFVARWDWAFDDGDGSFPASRAPGYSRRELVGRATGAVHTDLGLCRLAPGGRVDRHVHAFEQCAYVLDGHPVVESNGRQWQLEAGHYVFFGVGSVHGWLNPAGEEARWLELATPQRLGQGSGREDTFFLPGALEVASPGAPRPGEPTAPEVGYYPGTPPQQEALALVGPVRGREPVGMDTALIAYSGISVKMMVDENVGAQLLTMFMVDYEPGGAAQVHDHPFEEAYFFLSGEVEAEVEGETRTLRAGDVLFCGVGVLHGFFNMSPGRVRWVETQAPQPPRRHSYRWPAHWSRLGEQFQAWEALSPRS